MTTPDGLQPPLALAAAYAAEQQPLDASQPSSLDEQFASVLSGLMDDEITPETAIQEFRRASASATQQHRWVAHSCSSVTVHTPVLGLA